MTVPAGKASRAGRRLSSLRVAVVAAALAALGPVGCADRFSPAAVGMNWGHYLGAADLQFVCEEDGPDRYRLIFKDVEPPRLRLFEVLEDRAAGGADVRGRVLTTDDMAQIGVDDAYSDWRGSFASHRLSPLQFAVLAYRLENAGAFDPPAFGGTRPPNSARLLIGGCRAGAWFFHFFDDPRAAGELIALKTAPPMRRPAGAP